MLLPKWETDLLSRIPATDKLSEYPNINPGSWPEYKDAIVHVLENSTDTLCGNAAIYRPFGAAEPPGGVSAGGPSGRVIAAESKAAGWSKEEYTCHTKETGREGACERTGRYVPSPDPSPSQKLKHQSMDSRGFRDSRPSTVSRLGCPHDKTAAVSAVQIRPEVCKPAPVGYLKM